MSFPAQQIISATLERRLEVLKETANERELTLIKKDSEPFASICVHSRFVIEEWDDADGQEQLDMLQNLHVSTIDNEVSEVKSRYEHSQSNEAPVTLPAPDELQSDMEAVKEHHLARKKDLVFRSRGHVTTASVLLEDPGKAVVAAPLLRIRLTKPDKILPEYLNWYINQRDAQIFFTSRAKGTVQKMISKQAIEDLEVSLPSL